MFLTIILLSFLSFLSGFPIAWAWGKYMHHSREFNENQAGTWDMIIVLLSTVLTLTLWKASGESVVVLITYAIGNGLGTKYVVRHNAKEFHRQKLAEMVRKVVNDLV